MQPQTVPAILVDVQLERNALPVQSARKFEAVGYRDDLVRRGAPDEARRRVGAHLLFGRQRLDGLG